MATPKSPEVLPGRLDHDDFWSLPDDGNRYEIIDGKLYVTPAPATRHQLVLSTRYQRSPLRLSPGGPHGKSCSWIA
jgi:hypothetical protein